MTYRKCSWPKDLISAQECNFATMLRAGIPFLADLLRVLILLAFYTVLRVVFIDHYTDVRPDDMGRLIAGGIRFDLWSIAWLSTPYFLLRLFLRSEEGVMARIVQWVFLLPNIFGLFMSCLDLEYFAFSKQRSTSDYFDIATGGGEFLSQLKDLFPDFLFSLFLFVIMTVLLISGYRKIGYMLYPEKTPVSWRILTGLMTLGLLLIAQRGGIQLKPITSLTAGQYTVPERYDMVLNTPFTLMQSIGKQQLTEVKYMNSGEAQQLWPVEHILVKDPADLVGYNVVLLIMESFSADMSGVLSSGTSQMPFLDSLMQTSIYFENAFANGTRSIDAVPAIISSIPPLSGNAFITSPYAATPHTSLANVLTEKGYHTSFYHGGKNGTMGFSDFTKTAGFHRYVGLEEYTGNGANGSWGVHDGPFFDFFADELNAGSTPFFATFFSLSSHHPYDIPAGFDEIEAATSDPLQRSIRYGDACLRAFFKKVKTTKWYANTLFIITADHTAENSDADRPLREKYRVPLVLHIPGKNIAFRSPKIIQHIDILPMTLDFLGHEEPFFAFGQDLRGQKEGAAIFREGPVFHYLGSQGVISSDGEKLLLSTSNGTDGLPLPQKTTGLYLRRLQACIQQFNEQMINRELVLK